MLGLIFKVVALILFVLAAANQVVFKQPQVDLIAWGLAAYVLGELLVGAWALARERT